MNHRLIPTLLLALSTAPAAAKAQPPSAAACELEHVPPERTTAINESMSWFAKPMPGGDYIFYIGATNRMVRQDNPSQLVSVPGSIDPVPTPDGLYLTVPMNHGAGFYQMTFYPMQAIVDAGAANRNASNVQYVYKEMDANLSGVYQTIGRLPGSTDREVTYRLITESPAGSYSEIRMRSIRINRSTETARPVGHVVSLCPGYRIKTPVISKNGLELSAYDVAAGTTKIFKIAEDGHCTEMLNLQLAAGKTDFSFDGKFLAFHLDQFSSESGDWFSGVSSRVTKNVYVAEVKRVGDRMEVLRIIPVTRNTKPGTASYYPAFRQDGRVVYMDVQVSSSGGRTYGFGMVNAASVNAGESLSSSRAEQNARTILGALWATACTQNFTSYTSTDAAVLSRSLNPAGCRELVSSFWERNATRISQDARYSSAARGISKQDLLAVCPRTGIDIDVNTQNSGSTVVSRRNNPAEIFAANCRDCHIPNSPNGAINWPPDSIDRVDEILNRLARADRNRMPPTDMDANEKKIMMDELQLLRDEIIQRAVAE